MKSALIEKTPVNVSSKVKQQLLSENTTTTPLEHMSFELRSDLDMSSENGSFGDFFDPQKKNFGKETLIPPEREIIKRASRTAQILL
jgi:hypothetical protein